MKKIGLLLLTIQTASAVYWQPLPNAGYVYADIGVVNTTTEDVNVSCQFNNGTSIGTAQTLKQNGSYHFTGELYGNGNDPEKGCQILPFPSSATITCTYTDQKSLNTGTYSFTACKEVYFNGTAQGCRNSPYSPTPPITQDANPPLTYPCQDSTCSITENTYHCPNSLQASKYDCKVAGYFAIGPEAGSPGSTYTLTWTDIKTSLVKGQTMATKLAADLAQQGSYGHVTASYDGNKLIITLPPPFNSNPNPFDGLQSLSQCESAYNEFQ